MRWIGLGLLLFGFALEAQGPGAARGIPRLPDDARAAALRDLQRVPERQEARKRAAVEKREREFVERMATFATAWNELVKGSEKGLWSAKHAKEAHKAFDRLVRTEGWVE
ncbi:MAG: hypothetical protein ACM336_14050 [Acidobacteriota bacterium]